MLKKAIYAAFLGALLVFGGARSARALTLADLLVPGAFIDVGDKRFDQFSYLATANMPPPTHINVAPVPFLPVGFAGLRFQGAWTDPTNDGIPEDALITYQVSVLTPGNLITDAHLSGNPSVIGGAGVMAVTEQFSVGPPTLNIFDIQPPGGTQTSDSRVISPGVTSLLVTKDIFASNLGGVPTLSVIDQVFSQGVPEPGTMAMLFGIGIGGSLLGFRLRRR